MALRVLEEARYRRPVTQEEIDSGWAERQRLCQALPVVMGPRMSPCHRAGRQVAEDGPKCTRYPFTRLCGQHRDLGRRVGIEWIAGGGEPLAEFIGQVQGDRGTGSRNGTKSSGIELVGRSWHGSVLLMLRLRPDRPKPSDPTKPADVMVQLRIQSGSVALPGFHIGEFRLVDLLALAERRGRLEIPPADRRMTHEQFEREYTSQVTFVCQCGAEIVMGMCSNPDRPSGDFEGHYYYKREG